MKIKFLFSKNVLSFSDHETNLSIKILVSEIAFFEPID